jgi:hypothetical protein
MRGTGGLVRVRGVLIGRLTTWQVVISPTTQQPTLFGQGTFLRVYADVLLDVAATVPLLPTPLPMRYGRPKPPVVRPCAFTGTIVELTSGQITLARGTIVYDA